MSRVLPSPRQIEYQSWQLGLFLHFGLRTFYEGFRDFDDRKMSPEQFSPSGLDCHNWAATARKAGFNYVVMTAKHHDGFALWPSKTTGFSVAGSPWRGGVGDVVREFLDACRAGVAAACRLSTEWTRGALLVQRLERGCDLGDAESCTQLAGVVQNGQHDVAPDRARIDTLLGRGCRLEHGPSCKQLGAHREAGGDHVDARAAFDRACMLGSGPGCAALARVLRAGMGGEVDPEGGAEAAARACELSPPDCPPPPVEDEPDPSGQDETEPSEEPAPHEPAPAPGLGPL